jgi:acetyl esterase/lipase
MSDVFELRSEKPSALLRFLTWAISRRPPVFPHTAEGTREYLANRKLPHDAPLPERIERKHNAKKWEAAGQKCVTLHPKGFDPAEGQTAQHIIYFHGGGFAFPMYKEHWPFVAKLADLTGSSVTVPLYNVVPEASHKDADTLADTVFAELQEDYDPSRIIAAGDSAGGHMAISLALRARRAGNPQPGKLVLFSPWLDLTLADEAARVVEPKDIMLNIGPIRVMGEHWAGARNPASPQCSPLYAKLDDLPPTQIFQGRHDLFVVDCRNFMARAREVNAPVTLYEYAGAPHVFMILPGTRETKDVMELVRDFLAG